MANHQSTSLALLIMVPVLVLAVPAEAEEREFRELSGFDSVDVAGNIDLTLRQGTEFSVEVVAGSGSPEAVVTDLDGQTLKIRQQGSAVTRFWGGSYEVNVTLPRLESLTAAGASDVTGQGTFTGESLAIRASGGSDVSLAVMLERLEIQTSGGSDLRLSGTTGAIKLVSSGGSDLNASSLEAREADLSSSGGSDVSITVSERIAVNASGGSDVTYGGHPRDVEVNASRGSDVRGH